MDSFVHLYFQCQEPHLTLQHRQIYHRHKNDRLVWNFKPMKCKNSNLIRTAVMMNAIYLLAFRHRMQHMTTITIKKRHDAVILQNAIWRGSLGSHQNSVDGGYVGTRTPITVGRYCKKWKKIVLFWHNCSLMLTPYLCPECWLGLPKIEQNRWIVRCIQI